MPGEMRLTFLISLAGIALLYVTLVKLELTAKHAKGRSSAAACMSAVKWRPDRAAHRATVPARPVGYAGITPRRGGKVRGGCLRRIVVTLIVYVAIMGARLQQDRLQELTELAKRARARDGR